MTAKRRIPPQLEAADYEYPADRTALQALKTLKPVEYATRFFLHQFAEPWLKSKLFGHGIRVSHEQLPRVHNIACEAAEILNVQLPDFFVLQNPFLNAYTVGVDNRNIIVLHHSLLQTMTDDELLFIIAHEMGHIKSQHVLYHTLSQWLSEGVSTFIRWATVPSLTALWAWQRKSEITADRAGLIATQDVDIASRALAKLAIGASELIDSIDLPLYVRDQLLQLNSSPTASWPEFFERHPFLPRRIAHLVAFADSDQYNKLWR